MVISSDYTPFVVLSEINTADRVPTLCTHGTPVGLGFLLDVPKTFLNPSAGGDKDVLIHRTYYGEWTI